jgi:hypothetical protein
LATAAYAREAMLRRSRGPRPVPVVNIRFVGQLGRLANNLNQLTKLAHEGRTSPLLLPCLQAILAEVHRVRRLLIGLDPICAGAPDDRDEVVVERADDDGRDNS